MRKGECPLVIDKSFEPDGRIPLFPETSFSVPFRYGLRLRDDLYTKTVAPLLPSQHLPPVMLAAPPVLLVGQGRQELLNRDTLQSHVAPALATPYQAYCVMEIPVTDWHSREVQFLRFYYRHIEPTRLGLGSSSEEPIWKIALREILGSTWLYRYLSRNVASDRELTNIVLSRLLWNQASPKTIANFKSELRKEGVIQASWVKTEPAPASVIFLDEYRTPPSRD